MTSQCRNFTRTVAPRLAALLLMLAVLSGSGSASTGDGAPPAVQVTRWHYQLQNADLALLAASDADLVVIDYATAVADGVHEPLSRDEVASLKTGPDGRRRTVLAYMSIGEAEDYRFYWQPGYASALPAWHESPSRQWPDNHHVRYWMEDWKSIIVRQPGSYLSRIQEAGFDGVYLDRVDAYERLVKRQPAAKAEMMWFIAEISAAAKARDPSFLVFVQNGEELLEDAAYRGAIDGIAKEDLVFGARGDGRPNAPDLVGWSIEHLRALRDEGKPVLVVEYLDDPVKQAQALAAIAGERFVPLFARRALDHPPAAPPGPGGIATTLPGGTTQPRSGGKVEGVRDRRAKGCVERRLTTTRCDAVVRTANASPTAGGKSPRR